MAEYSHRERVLLSFNHQEADRIPIDLMGNASMLLDKTYLRLRNYLKLSPIPPVRSGATANYYDDRILEYLDIDFRRIFLKKNPYNKIVEHEDGIFYDAWGIGFMKLGVTVNAVKHPLSNIETVEDVESYNWPNAKDMFRADGLKQEAKHLYEDTDYALVARNPLSEGFLERSSNLMGMEEFYMNLLENPAICKSIIAHLLEIYKGVYSMFLDAIGPYVQMVEVGDDLGGKDNLLISPEMYREFIKPAEMELYSLIHEKAPEAALFHHTDGAVFELIPDLIDVGVNVLNPIQTSAKGMEAHRLKEAYEKSIVFHGAIENIEGDVNTTDIISEVEQRIDALSPGGGYVLSCCNHMIDVKPENIITMFKTAKEYGRYKK
jgi:uroporphyrinogen decarboxylase